MTDEQPTGGGPADAVPETEPGKSPPVAAPPRRRRRRIELVLVPVAAIVLCVIIAFALIVKEYRIPSGAMAPTLKVGQHILVNDLSTHPGLGQIVVFHPPAGADAEQCGNGSQGVGHRQACDRPQLPESSETFVKRVVGLPGDHLYIKAGRVWRNGAEEKLYYSLQAAKADARANGDPADQYASCTASAVGCNFPQTIVVPPGDYFMLGDNTGNSDDSRFWGPVPQKWIVGVYLAKF